MTSRSLAALAISLLAACSSSDADSSGSGAGGAAPIPQAKLAADIAITEVALFQGPKVSLMKDGARIDERSTPVVIGREGLLRVYFKPAATWKP